MGEINGSWRELTDQSYDRTVRVEIVSPEACVRERCEKGAYDDLELFACELVEWQPLAKKPPRSEATGDGLEHLAGIQIPSSGMPGDEEIGYDDIEGLTASGEVTAAVVKH
jgi:hypothetical protein